MVDIATGTEVLLPVALVLCVGGRRGFTKSRR